MPDRILHGPRCGYYDLDGCLGTWLQLLEEKDGNRLYQCLLCNRKSYVGENVWESEIPIDNLLQNPSFEEGWHNEQPANKPQF